MKRSAAWLLCLIVIASAACQRRDHLRTVEAVGQEAPAPAEEPKRTVAFAPVAMGPVASVYPQGRMGFAKDLASRLDWRIEDLDGEAPENLPDSDAQDWKAGPVPAAAGDYLVVLTRVVDVTHQPGTSPDQGEVVATVEMKAVDPSDPTGAPVFFKRAKGRSAADASATKMMGDASKPESVAVWNACADLVGALATLIEAKPDQEGAPGAQVTVDVDSDPPHADVLVDNVAAGTTPIKLHLPPTRVTIRIERTGYQPWERQVVPSAEMRIQPNLVKLGGAPLAPAGSPAGTTAASPSPAAPPEAPGTTPPGDKQEPQPKRAELDPLMTPPTPSELVVPGAK